MKTDVNGVWMWIFERAIEIDFSVGKHLVDIKHLASIKMLTDLKDLPDLTIDEKLN